MTREPRSIGFKQNIKWLVVGVAILFVIQNVFQFTSFVLHGEYKGGVVTARSLILEGVRTWPVILALLHYFVVTLFLLLVSSIVALLAALLLSGRVVIRESVQKVFFLVLLLSYMWLMILNVYEYPNSYSQVVYLSDFVRNGVFWPYYMALAYLLGLCLLSTIQLVFIVRSWLRTSSSALRRNLSLFPIIIVVGLGGAWITSKYSQQVSSESHSRHSSPNIILIGLDSVRADLLGKSEFVHDYMPKLGGFLYDSETARFTNANVPIARTFAAWYSVLSGNFPKTSGVRYNLQQISSRQKQDTIVARLNAKGYYTVYGSDEKRFSAIDESYGFQQIIGPPAGAAEWILSFLEDSPIHNLFRSTVFAPYLFPHSHANRASHTVYRPENFVSEVQRELQSIDRSKPLFLSLHLCLSHWPYLWAERQTSNGLLTQYLDSLIALDEQFSGVMNILNDMNLLENSLLVVFSDHGEGFLLSSVEAESARSVRNYHQLSIAPDRSPGHGTDLKTLSQNQVLLGIRDNTNQEFIKPGEFDQLVSLVDIAPTLADAAGLRIFESDGKNLGEATAGQLNKRAVFSETGIDMAVLHESNINVAELIEQGASMYEVTDGGLLQLKANFHNEILLNKQWGAMDGRYLVTGNAGEFDSAAPINSLYVIDKTFPEKVVPFRQFQGNQEVEWLVDRFLEHFGDEFESGLD